MARAKKNLNIDLGRRIRACRERLGFTREELAERVGISPRFEADIERGSVGPSLETLKRFCTELGVSSDSLLWDQPNRVDLSARLVHLDERYLEVLDNILAQQVELIRLAEKKEEKLL